MPVGVGKNWTPAKPNGALKPSRIRRKVPLLAPVDPRAEQKAEIRTRQREMWGGITGVVLFSAAIAVLVMGLAAVTISKFDAAAEARSLRFGQCYNTPGSNCVLDGATIRIAGERIAIAGLDAPQIDTAKCAAERTQGIDAAVKLADLLNSGRVRVSVPFRDASGREVRKVAVNGEDVAATMIDAGAARKPGDTEGWCG